ncbi:hypothetical protein HMPREF1584_01016 [Gardnerella vaginalis JCP8481A]|nr:hypothetical protein HMPREF1585_00966 [Gardnerella vaginalis JCP8481B]EPI42357.1 hypothetical protein HMPREF1584_01016 [Gardnerella vaginalis JCP8481A]
MLGNTVWCLCQCDCSVTCQLLLLAVLLTSQYCLRVSTAAW